MPHGSMLKYFGQRGGPETIHGDHLTWPGTPEGFPVRGQQNVNLRQEEAENLPLRVDFHAKRFRCWIEEEHAEYVEIRDRCSNGWYMQCMRFDNWIPEHMDYVIRLEWLQIYGEIPDAAMPGTGFDARTRSIQLP